MAKLRDMSKTYTSDSQVTARKHPLNTFLIFPFNEISPPGRGGGTPLFGLNGYVRPNRVRAFRLLRLRRGIPLHYLAS